jgi:hypothetical protein
VKAPRETPPAIPKLTITSSARLIRTTVAGEKRPLRASMSIATDARSTTTGGTH